MAIPARHHGPTKATSVQVRGLRYGKIQCHVKILRALSQIYIAT
jgi:hypothetical protein